MSAFWPATIEEREELELTGFLPIYNLLHPGVSLVPDGRGAPPGPDYYVRNTTGGQRYGVELTSAYSDDDSVDRQHKAPAVTPVDIDFDPVAINQYQQRVLAKVVEKIRKAQKYDRQCPLILSVYVNEYIAIYLDSCKWDAWVKQNEAVFDKMQPFREVVLWPIGGGGLSIRRTT